MSRTKFNLGICRRIFSWTACAPSPLGVASHLGCLPSSAGCNLTLSPRPRVRVVPSDVQVNPSCFDSRSFSARSPAETASLPQAAALAVWVGFGCQPWFYWRLRGLQLSPVMRGGIQLGKVLSPQGHSGHQAL